MLYYDNKFYKTFSNLNFLRKPAIDIRNSDVKGIGMKAKVEFGIIKYINYAQVTHL